MISSKRSRPSKREKDPTQQVLIVEVIAAKNLVDSGEGQNPYVVVSIGKTKFKTKVLRDTRNPVWEIGSMNEVFHFKKKAWTMKEKSDVVMKVMDWDRFKADDRLGMVTVPIKSVEESKKIDQWYPLKAQKAGDFVQGELHLRLEMTSICNEFVSSPLWRAVKKGDEAAVFQLLPCRMEGDKGGPPSGIDFSEQDQNGETLLHLASKTGKTQIIERLLRWDISVTAKDKDGNTALHTFCRHFAYPSDLLENFIKKQKADVNAQNNHGETPLHHVVFNQSIKLLIAQQLLEAGAKPNIVATNGDAPLHYAVEIGRTDLVKLFIAYGADCSLVGSKGKVPVALAKQLGNNPLADVIQDSLHVHQYLKKLGLEHLIFTFLEQELYIHHLEDIPDASLAKYVKNPEEREKLKKGIDEFKMPLERKETFWKRQEILTKQREELRKKESHIRNTIVSSLHLDESSNNSNHAEWEIDLSDLEFIQSLGHGASGAVFRGTYQSTLPVAIKVLKTASSESDKEVKEFIKEFSIAAKVKSPYIVHFYGATLRKKLCMVMELCEKGSLYNLLKDPEIVFDWKLALSMLEETCQGIEVLHNHSPTILHRDLKTLNVLVTAEYHCKICDFGLSRFDTSSNADSLMKCKGTFAYIAREVFKGEGYYKQSDVYSLAIMFWEFVNKLITGTYTRPFQEIASEFAIIRKAGDEGLRPQLPEETPQCLVTLITSAWHSNYNQRPDVTGLLEGLQAVKREYAANTAEWDNICKNKDKSKVVVVGGGGGGGGGPPKIRRQEAGIIPKDNI